MFTYSSQWADLIFFANNYHANLVFVPQDHESMLAAGGGSDFRGAPQGGVASTVGGFSQFGGSASQFSSNYHSQTAASNFSANPQQQYYPQGAKPNRYQHPRSPASTVSASTFVTKDIPRQWGPAGGAQWEGYRESANGLLGQCYIAW